MDEPDGGGTEDLPPTTAVGSVDHAETRRLYAVIGVLFVVVVVLLIRPWGDGVAQPRWTPGASAQSTQGTPVATPAPPAVAALEVTCGSPSGWRAATLQEWARRDDPIRSWIAIAPVAASGPGDPAIPFAPIATGRVVAIGYCAPIGRENEPPAGAVASLWTLQGDAASSLALVPLEPLEPDPLGGLWLPPAELPSSSPGTSASPVESPPASPEPSPSPDGAAPDGGPGAGRFWPPGRYLVRLATPDGSYDRWLGIQIEDLSLLVPRPSPSEAGGASDSAAPGASRATPAPSR